MELKNILARQPGAEVHQQLENYKQTIKEKTNQMRKLNNDCKNAQQQQEMLKYDISRLKEEI